MSCKRPSPWLSVALAAAYLGSCTDAAPPESRLAHPSGEGRDEGRSPNLIVIFLDDAGFADLGVTGARYPTPHLDRLAAEGTLFTSFHVSQPICSASRAALLTGRYSNRMGITGALRPGAQNVLPKTEATLAELARANGYATAIFGKWHLGDDPDSLPTQHGFDEFAGLPYSNDMWPARSAEYPPLPFYEGTTSVISDVQPDDQETFTRRFTAYATAFIEQNVERPFFLYLPHPQPHVPLFVAKEFAGASGIGLYADVMMELDWSVGELLRTLEHNDLAERTWLIFTSDNGPWLSYGDHAGSAGPFRGGKHTVFEGGTRVPTLMRYPGNIPAGAVVDQNLMTIDLLPTFAALIGAELRGEPLDGKDVWPVLTGAPSSSSPHEAYFFWNGDTLEAVLRGRWKLHLPHRYFTLVTAGADGSPGELSMAELPLSLFDLQTDPGESVNLASQEPDVVGHLMALAEAHEAELRTSTP